MTQVYSDPSREDDPYALPDVEVFHVDYMENVECLSEEAQKLPGSETIGWYWWPCFPGCSPDGDALGPFDTEAEATADARKVD